VAPLLRGDALFFLVATAAFFLSPDVSFFLAGVIPFAALLDRGLLSAVSSRADQSTAYGQSIHRGRFDPLNGNIEPIIDEIKSLAA
jgi:hypothetical protein